MGLPLLHICARSPTRRARPAFQRLPYAYADYAVLCARRPSGPRRSPQRALAVTSQVRGGADFMVARSTSRAASTCIWTLALWEAERSRVRASSGPHRYVAIMIPLACSITASFAAGLTGGPLASWIARTQIPQATSGPWAAIPDAPVEPLQHHRDQPPRRHVREAVPVAARADLPRHHRPVERQGDALHPLHRPELPLLVLLLEARPVHQLQRLRGRAPGQHPLRRRTLLHQLPGLHGRRRLRRRPRRERDPHRPHQDLAHKPRQPGLGRIPSAVPITGGG